MNDKELAVQQQDMVPQCVGDDDIISIAEQAEARIKAVMKIKQTALMVTNAQDWCDQNGKPYLMASGAEKIANLFNISWRFLSPEPTKTVDPDGHYTYTYSAEFSMGTRTIQTDGSRSSKDKFFMQYAYEGSGQGAKKVEKRIDERDNERDVKMAAYTNLLGNGITRLLGIRNLTYEDLASFAKISQSQIGKVEYKKDGEKKPHISQPKSMESPKEQSAPGPNDKPEPEGPYASEKQGGRFYAIAKASGRSDDEIKQWLKSNYGVLSTKKIPTSMYDNICTAVAVREPGAEG
jgi:hypothetical protein